jgi:hypothetical protein
MVKEWGKILIIFGVLISVHEERGMLEDQYKDGLSK